MYVLIFKCVNINIYICKYKNLKVQIYTSITSWSTERLKGGKYSDFLAGLGDLWEMKTLGDENFGRWKLVNSWWKLVNSWWKKFALQFLVNN